MLDFIHILIWIFSVADLKTVVVLQKYCNNFVSIAYSDNFSLSFYASFPKTFNLTQS